MERLMAHISDLREQLKEAGARTQEECDAVARLVWDDWAQALWWDMQEEIKSYLEKANGNGQ